MTERAMRIVIVVSAGGSVMNALLHNPFFKSQVHSVVSDRECKGIEHAGLHSVPTAIFPYQGNEDFSAHLLRYLQRNRIDYVVSFFTKLFVGELLTVYKDRIINLHPSLLPAFKGLDGFGDTMRFKARYMGTTIHFVDRQVDEGKLIMQSICPVDPEQPVTSLRHTVFQHQCKSLLQVVKWLSEGRIIVLDDCVTIVNAQYCDFEFVPNLDFPEAIELPV